MLEHVGKRICGYPITGSFQGQVAWSLEQLELMIDVLANWQGDWTRWSLEVPCNANHSKSS